MHHLIKEQVEKLRNDTDKQYQVEEAENIIRNYVIDNVQVMEADQTQSVKEAVRHHVGKEVWRDDYGRVYLRHTQAHQRTVSMSQEKARRSGVPLPESGTAGIQHDQYAEMGMDGRWTYEENIRFIEKQVEGERGKTKQFEAKHKTEQEKTKVEQIKAEKELTKAKTAQVKIQEKTKQLQIKKNAETAQIEIQEKTKQLEIQHRIEQAKTHSTTESRLNALTRPSKRQKTRTLFDIINNDSNCKFRGYLNVTTAVIGGTSIREKGAIEDACERLAAAAQEGEHPCYVRKGCEKTGQVPLVYSPASSQQWDDLIGHLQNVLENDRRDESSTSSPTTASRWVPERSYTFEDLQSRLKDLFPKKKEGKYAHFWTLIDAAATDNTKLDQVCAHRVQCCLVFCAHVTL